MTVACLDGARQLLNGLPLITLRSIVGSEVEGHEGGGKR